MQNTAHSAHACGGKMEKELSTLENYFYRNNERWRNKRKILIILNNTTSNKISNDTYFVRPLLTQSH